MNRKAVFGLAGALLVVSLGLVGAKWKREHPTPTDHDLQLRQMLVKSKKISTSGKEISDYKLSPKERADVVSAILWIDSTRYYDNGPTASTRYVVSFKGKNDYTTIYLDSNPKLDFLVTGEYGFSAGFAVHPATSRQLRRWIEEHLNKR